VSGLGEQVSGVESENNGRHEEPVHGLHDVSTFPFLRKLMDCSCVEQVIVLRKGVDVRAEGMGWKTGVCESEKTMNESESENENGYGKN